MESVKKLFFEAVETGRNLEDFFENLIKEMVNSKKTEDPQGSEPSALHIASRNQDYISVKYLIKKGADVNSTDINGCSALHLVSKSSKNKEKNIEIAKCLVENGANVNSKSKGDNGITPLHSASWWGSIEIVKLLVENGAELEENKNVYGYRPLHMAAIRGHSSVVKHLLESGAQVDPKAANGETPFDLASESGHQDIAKFLWEKKKAAVNDGKIPIKSEITDQKPAVCILCFSPRNGVFVHLPCAHASLCESCCIQLKELRSGCCPTCRTPINDYKKMFAFAKKNK